MCWKCSAASGVTKDLRTSLTRGCAASVGSVVFGVVLVSARENRRVESGTRQIFLTQVWETAGFFQCGGGNAGGGCPGWL